MQAAQWGPGSPLVTTSCQALGHQDAPARLELVPSIWRGPWSLVTQARAAGEGGQELMLSRKHRCWRPQWWWWGGLSLGPLAYLGCRERDLPAPMEPAGSVSSSCQESPPGPSILGNGEWESLLPPASPRDCPGALGPRTSDFGFPCSRPVCVDGWKCRAGHNSLFRVIPGRAGDRPNFILGPKGECTRLLILQPGPVHTTFLWRTFAA